MTVSRALPGRTASPRTARAINDRTALAFLQSEGPLTAGQLKALTGLSRPSVGDLVERLQTSGLIAVVGESGEARRGPNARLYGIVADRAHIAGVDVRTGSISVAVADLLGRTVATSSASVDPAADARQVVRSGLSLLHDAVRTAGASALHTVALGAPGLIDPATGELSATGALPAWHADLVTELRRSRESALVLLENEVNLAALAEQRIGAAHDRDTFALLWLGHGVGAAVVLDGKLRRGASGGTGEIGFLPVHGTRHLPSATSCDGGFHSLAGSAAVCELARAHGLDADPGDDAHAAERAVAAAVAAGPGAEAFLAELAERIAVGAAAVCAVLDPGCVVLAGEVGRAGGDDLAGRVARRLAGLSPLRTAVRAGTVTGSAVLRGAVLSAMDAAQEALFASGR